MKQRVAYFVSFGLCGWFCLFLFSAQNVNAFKIEDAGIFEEQLAADDLISYFELRKRIETLTFSDLKALSGNLESRPIYPFLTEVIHKVIDERLDESIFLLQEDIYVNNVPRMVDEPFYEDARGYSINELNVESEYLYFPNRHYQYRENAFVEKDPMWLVSSELEMDESDNVLDEKIPSISTVNFIQEEHSEKDSVSWSHAFSFNHASNFITSFRQWIKKYQEPQRSVVLNSNSLILRDHYRLYGLDRSSGIQQWSFALPDDSKKEHYQTLYPPHQNKESYEIESAGGMIFAEINNSLICLEAKTQTLIWRYSLGAFTLCTKPVKVNDFVLAGVINSRGEIWFIGIDVETGKHRWESYLGTSSFLSPLSTLSLTESRNVFIATNHGALISILADSGEIQWIRKYAPKRYNMIKYWEKANYKNNYIGEGVITYDGEFLDLYNDTIYYKPRESNYVYSIDKTTGALIDELYIPFLEYTTIGIIDRVLVLAQVNKSKEAHKIIFIDLKMNKEVGYIELPESGLVMGAVQAARNALYFKIRETIYKVVYAENSIECKTMATVAGTSEWLIGVDNGAFITTNNKECRYTTPRDEQQNLSNGAYGAASSYQSSLDSLMGKLDDLIHERIGFETVISLLKREQMPFNAVSDKIVAMIENRQENSVKRFDPFLRSLSEIYSDASIVYKDATMDFQHLLEAIGVITDKENQKHAAKILDQNDQTIAIRGENVFIQPFAVIKGETISDFSLILYNDQLLCVGESGRIRWDTKIFYQPNMEIIVDDYKNKGNQGRLYGDDVSAYLFDDVMIINDRVNIIAINVHSGKHVWSMTSGGDLFNDEKILSVINDDELFKKYSISPSFVKNIMYKLQFSGDDMFVMHQDNLKKINPRTGIVTAQKKIKQEDIFHLSIGEKYLFAVSIRGDEVSIIDLSDLSVETIHLAVADKEVFHAQCKVIGDLLVMNVGDALIYVDGESKKSKELFRMNKSKKYFLESYNDRLFVITPFERIRCFKLTEKGLEKKWTFKEPLWGKVIFSSPPKEFVASSTSFYFIINGRIIFPIMRAGKYIFMAFNAEDGSLLWETEPSQIHGLFYYMSNATITEGSLHFILSTVHFGDVEGRLEPEKTVAHTKSSLFKVQYTNGNIEKESKLPGISGFRKGFHKTGLFRTRNRLLYNLYGLYIRSLEGEI